MDVNAACILLTGITKWRVDAPCVLRRAYSCNSPSALVVRQDYVIVQRALVPARRCNVFVVLFWPAITTH